MVDQESWILDSSKPSAYGPRGFGGDGRKRCHQQVADVESMADDTRDGERDRPSADEAMLSARLRRLGERLSEHKPGGPSGSEPSARAGADPSAIARGFRLSSELVAGVLGGAAVGWLLDWWLGISPWGMIVFLLLGFAAGVLNVMRVAGVVPQNRPGPRNTND
jgi:ATP synthase protein I